MEATSRRSCCESQAIALVFALAASACAIDGRATTTMTDEEIRTARHIRTCDSPADEVQCHSRVLVDAVGEVQANFTPAGFGPSELRSAYKITGTGSSSMTIAIIAALGYPTAESDLAAYRAQFGLPPCTTANGCFRKVNQSGSSSSFPAFNLGWARESALDLDIASAICPNCKLLLVEANNATFADLAACVNTAASLGARVISNSYGGSESSGGSFEPAYNHSGIAITASSGNSGFGVQFPASSPHVTAVGGTSLSVSSLSSRGWSEIAWSGAGSGCSSRFTKPSWQHDTSCSRRTVADVSAVADPNTGVAAFAPLSDLASDWLVMGGTSVAAPLIGGVYAVNGGPVVFGSDPYSHTSALFDVRSGSNGSCSGSYLCTAKTGYDGPTGLGTPNGVTAF